MQKGTARNSVWSIGCRAFLLAIMVGVCGCDPIGLRRIELSLTRRGLEKTSIAVDSPEVLDALKIFDRVAAEHGFRPGENRDGYIRVYLFHSPAITNDYGMVFVRTVRSDVQMADTVLFATFGTPGFLGTDPEAERLFVDVRRELVRRYGKNNVESHVFFRRDGK